MFKAKHEKDYSYSGKKGLRLGQKINCISCQDINFRIAEQCLYYFRTYWLSNEAKGRLQGVEKNVVFVSV
jgi:hypothetical protein